jgi:AcrR family transcriptional regulator
VLLDAAVTEVAERGPGALSLRALAATAGVSHAAPVHHFGDKAGLFTALSTEGFDLLADELHAVWEETGEFLEVGVRYVHFALTHRGHFEVMFRPDLLNGGDPQLVRAKDRAFAMLYGPLEGSGKVANAEAVQMAALASWSVVHGLATLVLSGNLDGVDLRDPDRVARQVIAHCHWGAPT